MAKKNALLLQYLEGVSWRILEEYPDAVRELIRRRAGVYALYRGRKLYYVGLASNLMGRIRNHLRDRHHGSWDKFSVYLTQHHEHMKELESLLLRIVKPPGNSQSGKFSGSQSLLSGLNRRMTGIDADRRARLLGGNVARRRARSRASRAKGRTALAGISDRRIALRGKRSGKSFRASLLRDGTIRYRSNLYRSPTAAARAAVRGPANGWSFWLYQNDRGAWVPLRSLRR